MLKKLLLFVLVAFLIFIFSLYFILIHRFDDITITLNNDYSCNHICFIEDNYYYTKNNTVCNQYGESIIEGLKAPLICSYNDNLYVYSDNTLMCFDENMMMTKKYDIGAEISSFGIKDNIFCGTDKELEPYLYALDSLKQINDPLNINSFDSSYLRYSDSDNYRIILSDHDDHKALKSCAIVSEDGIITRCKNEYGEYIVQSKGAELIASSALNTSEPKLNKLSYETGICTSSDTIMGYYPESISAAGSEIIFIGINSPSDPHIDHEDIYSIKNHTSDIIAVINADNMKIEKENKTKKGERVIYADDKKAITFYHGRYITYSVKNWKKIDSKKAPEIKKNGSYTFETCGNYVFVFDNNTSEVINKISFT